ncbi:UDP-N-acetylglucosamine 2-epimerase [Actinoplanes sp. NPDC051513]|uniref:UDP-N-acetylglucosamine 2-epimerase n=1 Tax=Actinoplanes sp. NPDC051513 TaxID=3363908 RepID=UPI00379A91F1
MTLPEVHLAGGTCAEALRLAPVAIALREQGLVAPVLIAAGPDPTAVAKTWIACGLAADITLPASADLAAAMRRYDQLWAVRTPASVVVRGENLAAALAAYWRRVPIMHMDAGQRSGSLVADDADADRRLLAQVATVHLAAAPLAAMNLLDERVVPGDVLLTGGTAVEAARLMAARTKRRAKPRPHRIVVAGTSAARDEPVRAAMLAIAAQHHDLDVIGGLRMPYPERSRLIAVAEVVVTDDADLAEEALAAGTAVLVPGEGGGLTEAIHAGSARQVDAEAGEIVAALSELLESRVRRDSMGVAGTPYGDGLAAARIAQATAALLGHGQFPDPMPARPEAGVPR